MNAGQMPWGKYRGEWVRDIPTQYLEWLVGDKCFNGLSTTTQSAVKLELKDRESKNESINHINKSK